MHSVSVIITNCGDFSAIIFPRNHYYLLCIKGPSVLFVNNWTSQDRLMEDIVRLSEHATQLVGGRQT